MNDMSSVIVPKSDQINADDLIAGPMTITIRDVQIRGGQEQPVSIYFDGSEKAFRPCKSMSRVLVQGWGPDASKYLGRSLTLYRDPTVKWAGLEVGGIRISHMSHIDAEKLMMLTATKGSRKPHKVLPLVVQQPEPATDKAAAWVAEQLAAIEAAADADTLDKIAAKGAKAMAKLEKDRPDLHGKLADALKDKRATFDGDPFEEADEPHAALVADLEAAIAAAGDIDALTDAKARFEQHADALPDTVAGALEVKLAARRKELAA